VNPDVDGGRGALEVVENVRAQKSDPDHEEHRRRWQPQLALAGSERHDSNLPERLRANPRICSGFGLSSAQRMRVTAFTRLAGLAALFALVVAAGSAAGVSGAEDLSIATNPTWSPDETQVAFAYTGTSTFRIVTAPASGGHEGAFAVDAGARIRSHRPPHRPARSFGG